MSGIDFGCKMFYEARERLMELLMVLTSEGVVVPSAFLDAERLVLRFNDAFPCCFSPM